MAKSSPFKVNEGTLASSYNTLFDLIFRQKGERQIAMYSKASDKQIMGLAAPLELVLNETDDGLFLCLWFDGKVYKLKMT
jgi:hypothetical protein